MRPHDPLAEHFEAHRSRLRGVAYRMLGSLSEADDAVQEAWLRLNRIDAATVENLGGWLTTVVARVCLDALRARRARREEPIETVTTGSRPPAAAGAGTDPEGEAVLADMVGVALLVVLDTLSPAERLAFVLHDLFGVPFGEIAAIMDRSPAAAKQLASRARRRVRGAAVSPAAQDARRDQRIAVERTVVEAFLRATRAGDIQGLLAVLDPDAVIHIDAAARVDGVVPVDIAPADVGRPREIRGARLWVGRFVELSRHLPAVETVLIDGSVGVIVAPRGRLVRALTFTVAGDRITRVEAVGDPARLRALTVSVL